MDKTPEIDALLVQINELNARVKELRAKRSKLVQEARAKKQREEADRVAGAKAKRTSDGRDKDVRVFCDFMNGKTMKEIAASLPSPSKARAGKPVTPSVIQQRVYRGARILRRDPQHPLFPQAAAYLNADDANERRAVKASFRP